MCKYRIIAVILLTLQLASCASETSEQPPSDSNESSADAETTRVSSNLPDKDYGGAEFNILYRYVGDENIHNFFEYDAEEQNGELLNDTVYERNRVVEERFNIEIVSDSSDYPCEYVNTLIAAGDCDFNLVADRPVELARFSTVGMFAEIDKLPYIDIDMPWWNKNANEAFRVEDRLCFVTGDYVLYEKQRLPVMLFGAQLARDYSIGDLYTLVRDGGWTVDRMNEFCALTTSDLDGDGIMNHEDDQFGLLCGSYTYIPFLLAGMDNSYSSRTEDGSYELIFTSERMVDSIEKLGRTLFSDATVWGETVTDNWTKSQSPQNVFEEGRALFYCDVVQVVRMIEADIEYGILPLPKYDESQEKYLTTVQYDNSGAIGVPTTVDGDALEFTGIILEALAEESHYTTLPAFIEGVFQVTKAPDAESADMLEMIFSSDNIVYDMFAAYNIGNLNFAVAENLYQNHGGNYVSVMEARRASIMADYERVINSFKELN